MAEVIPYVPASITVHLGRPTADAANVTVSFPDYVKNVASSEIFPTWEPSALRANILAIISFALNRVYTEHYRSRGYPFDITSSTAFDQAFVDGRNVFENISQIVNDIFDDYIRRQGFVEPLASSFCNGTTVTCSGMSQWGSQALAKEGYNSIEILKAYYGADIEIVTNAPVKDVEASYPGTPLRLGDTGPDVLLIQTALNRISQNYPAITKISPATAVFDETTQMAVRKFQEIFDLVVDGIVGRATWYYLLRIYVAVKKLSELQSEGQTFTNASWEYPDAISEGDAGFKVTHLQYMLSVLSDFVPWLPPLTVDGFFGPETKQTVLAFHLWQGLEQTGVVGDKDWDAIYSQFIGIESTVFQDASLFPLEAAPQPDTSIRALQENLQQTASVHSGVSAPPVSGIYDKKTQLAVTQFQKLMAMPTTGKPTDNVHKALAEQTQNMRYSNTTRYGQYPGYHLSLGKRDSL